jgi:hypothetical protein
LNIAIRELQKETNKQGCNANTNYELFHELFPYYNNKQSNTLFLPNIVFFIFKSGLILVFI